MRKLPVIAALALPVAAFAQMSDVPTAPRDKTLYVGSEEMAAIAAGVPADPSGKPGAFSKRLFQDSTYSTSFIRLTAPDTPHAHGAWSEIFVVREGAGVVETGGTITGVTSSDSATHRGIFLNGNTPPPAQTDEQKKAAAAAAARRAAQGDKAGTDIVGGTRQAVKAGDIVLVPAGVAHRWVKVDQPIIYLDIKFPKAQ